MSLFPCRICGRLSGVIGRTFYGCIAEPHSKEEIEEFEKICKLDNRMERPSGDK